MLVPFLSLHFWALHYEVYEHRFCSISLQQTTYATTIHHLLPATNIIYQKLIFFFFSYIAGDASKEEMKQPGKIQYFPLSVEVFLATVLFWCFFVCLFFLLTAALAGTIPCIILFFKKSLWISVPAEYSAVLGLVHDNQHRVPFLAKNGF